MSRRIGPRFYLGLEQKDAAFAEFEKAFQGMQWEESFPLKANLCSTRSVSPELPRRAHFYL